MCGPPSPACCLQHTHKECHLVTLAKRFTDNLLTSTATREMLVSLALRLALSEVSICSPPLRNGPIFMKNAQCAEVNFPIFISWVMVHFVDWCLKRCAMLFWNRFLSSCVFCAIFCFWDMVDFVFDIHSELSSVRSIYRH